MKINEIISETINPDILDPRFTHTQEIGEYTYKAYAYDTSRPDREFFRVQAFDGPATPAYRIADILFRVNRSENEKDSHLESINTWVADDYRKQNIASTMYAYAKMLGNTIRPSEHQLPDGKAMWKAWKKSGEYKHLVSEDINSSEYVYHASYLPNLAKGLNSVIKRGLVPSNTGYSGPGVYFSYTPAGGFYHVDPSEATLFRVKWQDLVNHFGLYPKNSNGIQRTDDEIIVPSTVPASMLEVEYFPGEWWDVQSAYYSAKGPVNESIDVPVLKLGGDDRARAKAWIEKVYAKYPTMWQNNHVMLWGEGEDQQMAVFELVPSLTKRGAVEVKWIQAYPLRQGVGSRAMKELQSMAQEDGIGLTLFPWDKGQVSQAKLTKFYKGQGFSPVVKGSKSMHWAPELREADVSSMSTKDMIAYLRQHHDKNLHQDYLNYLNTFSGFALKDIPVNSIKTELSGLDKAKVEQYKKMDFSKAPPIVMGDGYILDGYHRATVAKALGIPVIKAYVGIKGQQGVAEHLMKEDAVNTTTLNQLYGGNFPDRDEAFWDEVSPSEFDKELTIQTMPKHKVQIMLLSQYRAEHLDDIADMMDEDQQEIVQRYMNDPALSSKVIVISGHRIIDGNHRALAAAFKGVPINYVDLAELDEPEEVDEAENTNTLNFEEGDCPIMAVAMHRLTGYPIYALVEWDSALNKHVLVHAYVKGNAWCYDAEGGGNPEYYLQKYPNDGNAEEVQMTEKEVLKMGYGNSKVPSLARVMPIAKEILSYEDDAKLLDEAYFNQGIKAELIKQGYKYIAKGIEQAAYVAPDGSVLKIFGTSKNASTGSGMTHAHKVFKAFADYCLEHPDNEFLPQFSDWTTFEYDGLPYLQIKMERLFPIKKQWGRLLQNMANACSIGNYFGKKEAWIKRFSDSGLDEFAELVLHLGDDGLSKLWDTIEDLVKLARKLGLRGLDLHPGNFMLGSDGHIVINDPFYSRG